MRTIILKRNTSGARAGELPGPAATYGQDPGGGDSRCDDRMGLLLRAPLQSGRGHESCQRRGGGDRWFGFGFFGAAVLVRRPLDFGRREGGFPGKREP